MASSLDELMAPPIYVALSEEHMHIDLMNEWMLTADAFMKFQLRRQALASAGQEPMRQNMLKILLKLGDNIRPHIDSLFDDTINYMRYALWTSELYVLQKTELKVYLCLSVTYTI